MQLDVKGIKGWTELQAAMKDFSERRVAAAMATALSKTGAAIKAAALKRLPEVFDRPKPYTMQALYLKGATADRLSARVWFKEESSNGGTPATKFLLPNVEGGARRTKRFEVALQAAGVLPKGWQAMPGQGAQLDAYGNMTPGQIIQILSQLRITMTAGHDRNMAFDARKQLNAQRKAGGRFFVVPVGTSGRQPGVYQREFIGRNVTPVLVFVRTSAYRKRFNFHEVAQAIAQEQLPIYARQAVADHIGRLAVRSGGSS